MKEIERGRNRGLGGREITQTEDDTKRVKRDRGTGERETLGGGGRWPETEDDRESGKRDFEFARKKERGT